MRASVLLGLGLRGEGGCTCCTRVVREALSQVSSRDYTGMLDAEASFLSTAEPPASELGSVLVNAITRGTRRAGVLLCRGAPAATEEQG